MRGAWLAVWLACLGSLAAQEPTPPVDPARFELVESNAREVLVLDACSGILFAVNLATESAMMIDPVRGQAIARPLVTRDAPPPDPAAQPSWPTRAELAQRGTRRRFQTADAGGAAVFDTHTGRLFLLDGPEGLRVIDPVEGLLEVRPVELTDTAVALDASARIAVALLRQLVGVQLAYRARDPDGDCGQLSELVAAELLPPALADGEHEGYRFELVTGAEPGRWLARAVPLAGAPARSFAITDAGVVHFTLGREIPLDPGCQLPDWTLPLED